MKYRKEIDGLRAIAVLPVMLFHAGFSVFSGGFIGVDVFFVISGYLITTLIITEMQQGRFTILRFYERRARRILPALFLVILISVPLAMAIMLPYQLADFAKSIVAVNLFVSNIFFWLQGGYFAGPNGEVPLLHTWSLAVEEQFYVLFPLFLIVVWRWGLRAILAIIIIITISSLAIAQWGSHAHTSANFYLMPSRAWELMLGSLSAIYLLRDRKFPRWASQGMSLIGLGLVLAAVFYFNDGTPHPSLWTLAPVSGAALIILFCRPDTLVYRLLSTRILVGIGLISYSAYLWHQPLLAFARIQLGSLSVGLKLTILGTSLLLAWLSWKFVEQPFRNRHFLTRNQIFGTGAAIGICCSVFSVWLVNVNGFSNRYQKFQQQFIAISPQERGQFVRGRYKANILNREFTGSQKKLLLIGDSFSEDFYNEILAENYFRHYKISAVYIPSRCQIYFGSENVERFWLRKDYNTCIQQRIDQAVIRRARKADIIVFSMRWQKWAAERLPETLRNMGFLKGQRVIIIGTKGFGKIRVPYLLTLGKGQLSSVRVAPPKDELGTNRMMAKLLPKTEFVNVIELLCGKNNLCPLFTPSGNMISYDGFHLTKPGARYVGQILFNAPPLNEFVQLRSAKE